MIGCIVFNMGIGIILIFLYNLFFNGGWLCCFGVVVFIFNVVFFIFFVVVSVVRILRWKGIFLVMLKNYLLGLYWGMLLMGFIIIVVCLGEFYVLGFIIN